MNLIRKITILVVVVLMVAACSRKKNTFITRNYHAVTAEFNALYNGGVAFEQGKEGLATSYRDNFWEILPVERIELEENFELTGESGDPNFNRAEEKAVKAIQKHSIYINGKEHNPQIDEAYMMLGKARYFDGRFIPALDAFNFILNRYPTSNSINHAKVWKAKANIRLENEEIALEELQDMLKKEDLDDDEIADASAIMAQAFINLDSIDGALPHIKMAAEYVRDNELKGRYLYIKGQIYNRLGHKDSADIAFDEVIELNRKSPRVYMINAYIAKAKNFDYDKGNRVEFLELLYDLEKNRENRPFLDKIYNQIGDYYRNNDSIDTAIKYYNKSIKAFNEDNILQAVNYQTLAEIKFDHADYKAAGAYYDSTLSQLEETSRLYRRIKKKRDNLDDVITYEDIATVNDSILRLANMSDADLLAYFTDYVAKLKEKNRLDSIAKVERLAREEEGIRNNEFFKNNSRGDKEAERNQGPFYFYSNTTVAYGRQEFRRRWGNRKLEDNWRLSSKLSSGITESTEPSELTEVVERESYKPETWIARVPKDEAVIDSLKKERDFAYYQLGLIYKEKFREYGLASKRLEKLLTYGPEERLILPAKYNLYKIYMEMERPALADKHKNDILTNHSDSRYAEILRNPNSALATDESSPEYKYFELYKVFEATRYQEVIDTCDEYITVYNGNAIVPKLELLKATALARKEGFEAYKEALNYVALNYPNDDEGKKAQDIISNTLPKLANKAFVGEEESSSWKVVYDFPSSERETAEELKTKLDDAIEWFNYTNMSASVDYYDPNTILVIIHGLNTKLGGAQFADVLEEHKKYKISKSHFEISTENYKIVQIHKNLNDYLSGSSLEPDKSNPQK